MNLRELVEVALDTEEHFSLDELEQSAKIEHEHWMIESGRYLMPQESDDSPCGPFMKDRINEGT